MVVIGTQVLCTDKTFEKKVRLPGSKTKMPNGNKRFCDNMLKWAFQEIGVLHATDLEHVNVSTNSTKSLYSIKDDMVRYCLYQNGVKMFAIKSHR